jgi:hypothetical protein
MQAQEPLELVIKRLRPELAEFRDERGRVLLDVPEGPLPERNTTLPPRFLPAFDNAVLGYDDRCRIIDDLDRGLSVAGARFLLLDGRVTGVWVSAGSADAGIEITIRRLRRLSGGEEDAVTRLCCRLHRRLRAGRLPNAGRYRRRRAAVLGLLLPVVRALRRPELARRGHQSAAHPGRSHRSQSQ